MHKRDKKTAKKVLYKVLYKHINNWVPVYNLQGFGFGQAGQAYFTDFVFGGKRAGWVY